jgi:tetratricopeptide (TPR) repeat protein
MTSCLNNLGVIARLLGNYAEAQRFYRDSLDLCRQVGDRREMAIRLHNLGVVTRLLGEYDAAQRWHRQSLAICQEIDDRRGIAKCLNSLGTALRLQGENKEARRLYLESVAICRETDDLQGLANGLHNLGLALCALDELQDAKLCFQEALEIAARTRAVPRTLEALTGMAETLIKEGKGERALEIVSCVVHHPALDRELEDLAGQLIAGLESEIPPRTFEIAWKKGKTRGLEYFVRLWR